MQTFLEDLAEKIIKDYQGDLADLKVIFPNRRAGLFFENAFLKHLNGPTWSPEIISLEDFILGLSPKVVLDKITLIFKLHEVYQKHNPFQENFEQFFFWGDLLIKDFDDVDKYMVDARPLFANLAQWKALTSDTSFLTPEQIRLIEQFWQHFEQRPTDAKEKFKRVWDILYSVYSDFRVLLEQENHAYSGMVYRDVAKNLKEGTLQLDGNFVFAGFNALTKAEEEIISYAVRETGAKIYWDYDAYYTQNNAQEAGSFFREYRNHTVLSKTFPAETPNSIATNKPEIEVIGVSGNMGQAKLLSQYLEQIDLENPEKTAVILGDEGLLFPVLHALPEKLQKVNVTMGYPLKSALLFTLMEEVLQLQKHKKEGKEGFLFNHRYVVNILKHALIRELIPELSKSIIHQIETTNKVWLDEAALSHEESSLLPLIFKGVKEEELFVYLKTIILSTGKLQEGEVQSSFFFQFYTTLNRLEDVTKQFGLNLSISAFIRLFRQIIQGVRVPFSGEPLEGLQVMGVLESRNLDFENIYILSLNEDNFPAKGSVHSYIPYNIRKAYGLPTLDQHDAIYGYLFYRLLHRAKHVKLFYNTESGITKGGEMSRYIQQLLYESNLPLKQKLLANPVSISPEHVISIQKTDLIKAQLAAYLEGGNKKLTPTALSTYLDCRLKFYFKYVAKLYEPDEVQEEVDAALFGNIMHDVLEWIYRDWMEENGTNMIDTKAVKEVKEKVPGYIQKAFAHYYGLESDKKYEFEGRNILVKEVVRKLIDKILAYDEQTVPFEILGLEEEDQFQYLMPLTGNKKVRLSGKIDRLDKVGETVRVLDYKSGGDKISFRSIEELFEREGKNQNKAALQTLLYSFLYTKKVGDQESAVCPGLFYGRGLFDAHFDYRLKMGESRKSQTIHDARPVLEAYEKHLRTMLDEIFADHTIFNQTEDEKTCSYCPYNAICNKG